jgi:HD-like signal output (HDOD) protein
MSTSSTMVGSAREETLKCVDRLPLPALMTTHLLARLARGNCDPSELASFIEKDALLSVQVLELANSAMFGRPRTINSVRHAVAMIGIGTVRKYALTRSIGNLFARHRTPSGFSLTRFNVHSVATGTLAELMAEELPVEYSAHAFIAGLLHDVGKLILAASVPDRYETILSMAAVTHEPLLECERSVAGVDHAELSRLACARWQLAEPIRLAAGYHHAPEAAATLERTRPGKLALSLAIQTADAWVNYLGMSVLPVPMAPEPEPPSMEFPGFSFSMERVLLRFEAEWKNLSQLFH